MKRLTAEQFKNEILAEKAEIIAEAKAKGYYYPELETQGEYHDSEEDSYRTIGGLDYYFLKCQQLGIVPKCLSSGLHYEAKGAGFTVEYCERDIILSISKLLTWEEINRTAEDGARYWAIGENGHKYSSVYTTKQGGNMFFCIPAEVKILGYVERSIKTFAARPQGNFTGGELIRKYGKENGYAVDNSDWFRTVITIDGKQYEYDRFDDNSDGSVTVTIAEVA